MENLTQAQKTIIDNLRNEFQSLNNEKETTTELFDIDSLFSDLNNDKIRKEEIRLTNVVRLEELDEISHNYGEQLKTIFEKANIYVWLKRHYDCYSIYFGGLSEYSNRSCSFGYFNITISLDVQSIYFNSGLERINEYLDSHKINFYKEGGCAEVKNIRNLNELLTNEDFKRIIKNIFLKVNQ